MQRLQKIDEDAGRPGAAKLRAAALLEGVSVTARDAQEFVKQQSVAQVYRPAPRSTGKISATEENMTWQIDLVDNSKFVRSRNKNFRFILVCIDVFSRKLYVEPQEIRLLWSPWRASSG